MVLPVVALFLSLIIDISLVWFSARGLEFAMSQSYVHGGDTKRLALAQGELGRAVYPLSRTTVAAPLCKVQQEEHCQKSTK